MEEREDGRLEEGENTRDEEREKGGRGERFGDSACKALRLLIGLTSNRVQIYWVSAA